MKTVEYMYVTVLIAGGLALQGCRTSSQEQASTTMESAEWFSFAEAEAVLKQDPDNTHAMRSLRFRRKEILEEGERELEAVRAKMMQELR